MIRVQCSCGKLLEVEDRFAGKKGKCPHCQRILEIPAAASSGPAPGAASGSRDPMRELSRAAAASCRTTTRQTGGRATPGVGRFGPAPGLLAGILILLTIVIPWMPMPGKTIMSWDIIEHTVDADEESFAIFLIGSWLIGVAAIVLTFVLKKLPQGITYAGIGFLGFILSIIMMEASGLPMTGVRMMGMGALTFFGILALAGLLPAVHLSLTMGPKLPIRILQIAAGGVVLVLSVILLIQNIADFSDVPKYIRKKMVFDFLLGMLMWLGLMAGSALAIIHAALARTKRRSLASSALAILYSYLGVQGLYLLVRPAIAAESGRVIPLMLNILFLLGSLFLLLSTGVLRTVAYAILRPRRPRLSAQTAAAESAPGATDAAGPQERLERLKSLLEQGLISEQEYNDARSRILQTL